jgi:hypothetical protein
MFPSKMTTIVLIAVLLAVLSVAGAVSLAGWGRRPDLEQQAADRAAARERWLDLIKVKGNDAFQSSANVRTLESCFKEGELAAGYEKVLTTSMWQEKYPTNGTGNEFDGAIEYYWMFRVEKPPAPDATGYAFYVRVQGDPPVIRRVFGSLTVD